MKVIIGFCFLALLRSTQTSGERDTYIGAVVEYHPMVIKDEAVRVATNVDHYIMLMMAAKDADIIVFPEGGLLTKTILSPIPNPKDGISPCDSTTFVTTEAVKKLSCASKENGIYSVVNLLEKRACSKDDKNCPSRGYYIHNTNVVFDRKGVVVARYSKFNLYDEPLVNRTATPDTAYFDTDFGVRFGMFICFDIMFPSPALELVQKHNITDFVYSTYWFSELPFLTASQTQKGWAQTHNVNFLASGVNYPPSATFGSGIYNGKSGELLKIMPETVTTAVLLAEIPKKNLKSKQLTRTTPLYTRVIPFDVESETTNVGINWFKDHMKLFESAVIEPGKRFDRTICSGENFCCDFQVSATAISQVAKDYTVRAIALNGVRKFGLSFQGGVQCCGVVVCKGPDIMNCTTRVKEIPGLFEFTEIDIEGDFQADGAFQMPTTLTDGDTLDPMPVNRYRFRKKRKYDDGNKMMVSMQLLWPVNNLHAFGIWGRDFSKDVKLNGSVVISTPGFYAVFVMSLVFGWNYWISS